MKLSLACLACFLFTISANSQNNYWKNISNQESTKLTGTISFASENFIPAAYQLFILDANKLNKDLLSLPVENANSKSVGSIIYLPLPDGTTERFLLKKSLVMTEKLAKKYPSIQTFSGQGIDDPSKHVWCDFTVLGFHGMITSANSKTVYINPLSKQHNIYSIFERNQADKSENVFNCALSTAVSEKNMEVTNKVAPSGNANDGIRRDYRLALCVTGEFSKFYLTGSELSFNDSIVTVLSAITTHLTRANQVYERDFGIRMLFVDNEDTLIFFNPSTDPFSNNNLNNPCQRTCDSRIGNDNYDVGHVLHKGGDNGNAGCIGCVCKNGAKGSGATTYHDPSLIDYFVVDYWTHELGHQFGANHTFTFSNEGTSAQIEPGSGSSIMGYAGITGSNTDIQPHSDDYFSCASIAQVSNYFKTASGGCALSVNTGNVAPNVNAGPDEIIPIGTPFVLKGKGTDANSDDVLTYRWEQTDAYESGSNTVPKATSTKGPLFRSINYSEGNYRHFPVEENSLDGLAGNKWEVLPTVTRDINFRLTVFDNHLEGGNNASDDVLIKVTKLAGPFKITNLKFREVLTAGTPYTVKWDVANTDMEPVNCSNVHIVLSTDGGKTFTDMLASHTKNDGEKTIIIPNTPTVRARIAIKAANNIFYDVMDSNFIIRPPQTTPVQNDRPAFKIQPNPAKEFTQLVFGKRSLNGLITVGNSAGIIYYQHQYSEVAENEIITIPVNKLERGIYFIKVSTPTGTRTEKVMINR